ncbi:MAG: hypothetical protein JSW21_00925 [Gammaproteobacteria bacterium]|nr:MAG: hypothetical protein JSW21_00925 [Gammaproteobacteria bacterium]
MKSLTVATLFAFLLGAPQVYGQQEPEQPAVEPEQEQEIQAEDEPLPEVDVWAEGSDSEDDVFIPSESISADASIAFPTDI